MGRKKNTPVEQIATPVQTITNIEMQFDGLFAQ